MRPEVLKQLLEINERFYRDFGVAFSATRQRVQPGVKRLLETLPLTGRWLDIGCGNGELGRELPRRGFVGEYWGVDASREMLGKNPHLLLADLADPAWTVCLPPGHYKTITALAVLHHIPSSGLRGRLLRQAAELLAPGGTFILSVWQFQHSPKLMARRVGWETVGLAHADLEPGDTLLDWRFALPGQAEQRGLRYVHLFTCQELAALAAAAGFAIREVFASDGHGGRLGLYQVWERAG